MGKSRRRKPTSIQAIKKYKFKWKKSKNEFRAYLFGSPIVVESYGSLQSPLQDLANGTIQSPFLLSKLFTKSPISLQAPQTLANMNQMETMKSNEVGGCFKSQVNPFKKYKKWIPLLNRRIWHKSDFRSAFERNFLIVGAMREHSGSECSRSLPHRSGIGAGSVFFAWEHALQKHSRTEAKHKHALRAFWKRFAR